MPTPPEKHPLDIRIHSPIWNSEDFVYTDDSHITGQPTLGAEVIFPGVRTIKIAVRSDTERHTINRAELVAITVALREASHLPSLHILTDSLFCIYSLRNFIANPSRYTDHLHRHLIEPATDLIRTRDAAGKETHIGKVKSHTGVKYNDEADEAAKLVASRKAEADIAFDEYGPPAGGLRTWLVTIRTPSQTENEPDRITHFTNLKAEPSKRYKEAAYAQVRPTTLYGDLLTQSRLQGAEHTMHAYSTSGFRQRRDAMEVAWAGAHKFRLVNKSHRRRFPTCVKYGQKLAHSHLLGGCQSTAKLNISRHHSTFKLLHRLLTQENGGRWPILAMDLGTQTEEEDDKPDACYATILRPEYLLPEQHRPQQHYKPDIVGAVMGYYIDPDTGRLTPDPDYEGRRVLQII